MYSRNNSIVFITIAFFAFVLLFVHAADVRTTGPIVKIKSLDDVSDHNVTKMIEAHTSPIFSASTASTI